ncbi:galactolipase DONGLE, chloroplastic-like [Mangifera indica]|uniref:galactolipase DONGLE, chloroplastic-like n=1 Tax=Mangifera indica TaxID=29780 RepID=UPI001CFC18AB|nr:galactolipase DONGLE, chloroplastic-like [Mangifera indica]
MALSSVELCPKPSISFGQVSIPKTSKLKSQSQSRRSASIFAAPAVNKAIKSAKTSSILAHFWREIQGFNNWENLVEPLHFLLRQEIIRYGEFVAACYKAFDLDAKSERYLSCKYGKKSMFREIGMENSGYEITKYIYATADVTIPIHNSTSCGRWIGYVAVSSDESVRRLGRRDIVIAFRGAVTHLEWAANLMSSLTPARLDPHNPRPEVKVESGFMSLYTTNENNKFGLRSCREQLFSEIWRLLNKYKGEEMSITLAGHSMGSSLALLLAYDVAESGLNSIIDNHSEIPVTVFSYAGPRVGNAGFKQRCQQLGVKVLRIVNSNDPITKLPGFFFNENFRVLGGTTYEFPWSYAHVGVEVVLDFFNMQNPSCVHDLEAHISLLKCPNPVEIQREGVGLLKKAREWLLMLKVLTWLKFVADNMLSSLVPINS